MEKENRKRLRRVISQNKFHSGGTEMEIRQRKILQIVLLMKGLVLD